MRTLSDIKLSVCDVIPIREEWLKTAIRQFVSIVKESEKENLIRIVLYGSMARGDYDKESDVDVFILVESGKIQELRDRFFDIGFDLSMSLCDTLCCWVRFSTLAISIDSYEIYPEGKPEMLPIYQSIAKDGIYLYDADQSEDGLVAAAIKKLGKEDIVYDIGR